jgi:hypothetical protein
MRFGFRLFFADDAEETPVEATEAPVEGENAPTRTDETEEL